MQQTQTNLKPLEFNSDDAGILFGAASLQPLYVVVFSVHVRACEQVRSVSFRSGVVVCAVSVVVE